MRLVAFEGTRSDYELIGISKESSLILLTILNFFESLYTLNFPESI